MPPRQLGSPANDFLVAKPVLQLTWQALAGVLDEHSALYGARTNAPDAPTNNQPQLSVCSSTEYLGRLASPKLSLRTVLSPRNNHRVLSIGDVFRMGLGARLSRRFA